MENRLTILALAAALLLAAPAHAQQLEIDAFTSVAVDLEDRTVVPFGVGGHFGVTIGSLTTGASATWSPINGHATRATLEISASAGERTQLIVFFGDTHTDAPEGDDPATDEPEDYGVRVDDFNTLGFGFRASNDGGGFVEARLNRVQPMDDARWSLEFRLSP